MGCGLALPSLASLLLAASLEPSAALRAEGRGTRSAPEGQPATSRAAAFTVPQVGLAVSGAPLRLDLGYAATLWTSDVQARPSALVSHAVEGRLELRPDAPWHAAAAASLVRGETDPLANLGAGAGAASQLASTGPIPFQSVHAEARADRQLDPRWTLTAGGRWNDTYVLRGDLRALLPPQRGAGASAGVSHRATERDAVTVGTAADWSETSTAAGVTTALSTALDVTWRRALTPIVDGWLRGGAALLYTNEASGLASRDVLPVAGAGVSRRAPAGRVSADLSATLTSTVDRFNGDVRPALDGRLGVSWNAAERVTLSAQGSSGRRLDGETTLGAADARAAWSIRPWLSLETGLLWRFQRERRAGVPSFSEAGVFAGLAAGRR